MMFTIVSGTSNEDRKDESNLGEALYLTEYIENGDIETVSFKISNPNSRDSDRQVVYSALTQVQNEKKIKFWFHILSLWIIIE